jgi:hypothetical protein
MRRFLDTRLARISKHEQPRDLVKARHRSLLRGRSALGALLREGLPLTGDGPAFAAALQLGETAAAELAGIPDTLEVRESDEALLDRDHAGAEGVFEARLWYLVRQYRDGRELDPASASPAELLAARVASAAMPTPNPPPQAGEG